MSFLPQNQSNTRQHAAPKPAQLLARQCSTCDSHTLPLLPGDVWRKIIAYVHDPITDGWSDWLLQISALSRLHRQIILNLYARYLSASNLKLASINKATGRWDGYRLIRHLTRHFPRIPAGYVEFNDYGYRRGRFPSFREISCDKSEKFFQQKFMRQRFFVTDKYTEFKHHSRGFNTGIDISEKNLLVPSIFIPIPARHHSLPICAAFVLHGICHINTTDSQDGSYELIWFIQTVYNSGHWSARNMIPSDVSQISQQLNTMQVFKIVQYIICMENLIPETIKELLDLAAKYPGRSDYNPNIIEQNEYTDWLNSTIGL